MTNSALCANAGSRSQGSGHVRATGRTLGGRRGWRAWAAQRSGAVCLGDGLAKAVTRDEVLHRGYTESGRTVTAMYKAVNLAVARVGVVMAPVEREIGDGVFKNET